MRRFLRITGFFILLLLLTVLTQVGGIALLIHHFTKRRLTDRIRSVVLRCMAGATYFLLIYSVISFVATPLLASPLGRVPLSWRTDHHLQPLNILTCLLNRNYVKPGLKETAFIVSDEMARLYPGTRVHYLDAGFPFMDGFPLLPHLSHDDGRKFDLAFCYEDSRTHEPVNDAPSWIGYGACEEAHEGERNMPLECAQKGYWQYSVMQDLFPARTDLSMDMERTKKLVELFSEDARVEKIFIEPHLVARMQIASSRVRFHGCQAVRHDDHVHIQINK